MTLNSQILSRSLGIVATLATTILGVSSAQAAITITGQQVGADFVFSYTGSIDLSGTVLDSTGLTFPTSFVASSATTTIYNVMGTGNYTRYLTPFVSQPNDFGISNSQILADSGFDDIFFVRGAAASLGIPDGFGVPDGYVSGDPISGSATYNNATVASLGLTPGTYVWELSNGDTITQTIVPEPLTLLGASAAVAFGAAFKRRKA